MYKGFTLLPINKKIKKIKTDKVFAKVLLYLDTKTTRKIGRVVVFFKQNYKTYSLMFILLLLN